jgi:hypothetical protein
MAIYSLGETIGESWKTPFWRIKILLKKSQIKIYGENVV